MAEGLMEGLEDGPERDRRALVERVARAWLSAPREDDGHVGASAEAVLALLAGEGRLIKPGDLQDSVGVVYGQLHQARTEIEQLHGAARHTLLEVADRLAGEDIPFHDWCVQFLRDVAEEYPGGVHSGQPEWEAENEQLRGEVAQARADAEVLAARLEARERVLIRERNEARIEAGEAVARAVYAEASREQALARAVAQMVAVGGRRCGTCGLPGEWRDHEHGSPLSAAEGVVRAAAASLGVVLLVVLGMLAAQFFGALS